MRIEQSHGYYTVNEFGQFHSFDNNPAIVIESYEIVERIGEDEIVNTIEGYKARYNNGERIRTERNNGEIFISGNIG